MYQAVISSWGKEEGHLPVRGRGYFSSRPFLQGRSPCQAFSETPERQTPRSVLHHGGSGLLLQAYCALPF